MERTAKCLCGAFRVIATGEPNNVNVCHCQDCQRRSGVPWTSNAYYKKSSVRLEGPHRIYTRTSAAGRGLNHHFCPDCGATVCWTAEIAPDFYGVPVGAFNDPAFPAPTVSFWEQSMYAWVPPIPVGEHFSQGRPIPPQT
jgi:hypothetical protein